MTYDNETSRHIYNPDYDTNAQWFVDGAGQLWIIPKDAEIEGPDGEMLDALNAICRANGGWVPDTEAERLRLTEVPHILRRFDPINGYYSA